MNIQRPSSTFGLIWACSEADVVPLEAMKLAIALSIYDNSVEFERELFNGYQDARAGINLDTATYFKTILNLYLTETYSEEVVL